MKLDLTFFVVVLADLVPLGGSNGRLLVHALSLARSVNGGSGGVVVVTPTHGGLVHLVTKGQPLGEVARIETGVGRRGVLVLRGVGGQGGFGVGSQSIIIGETILWADMLKNLLINVQFGASVGKAMVILAKAMAEVVLIVSHAAVAAVGRAIETLGIRT